MNKGDYVAMYMPMVCELPIAMVSTACAMQPCQRRMQGQLHSPGRWGEAGIKEEWGGERPAPVLRATLRNNVRHPTLSRLQLACARIGAVHAVVFGGFSAEALAGRLEGAQVCMRTCVRVY